MWGEHMFKKNPLFQNVEKKTGVNMDDIFRLANSIQNANFKDEATVRLIIKQVAAVANKPVAKETEDKIVDTLVNNADNVNFNTIADMLNQNNKK